MARLFVDTSAWYAYVNHSDPDHGVVKRALESFAGTLVTSNFVFDETITLVRYRLNHRIALRVGEFLLNVNEVDLLHVESEDEDEAWKLFKKRRDQTYSFTDCTTFALMKRFKINLVAALDSDFVTEGFQNIV